MLATVNEFCTHRPGFMPRELAPRVVEIGKRPPEPSIPDAQEIGRRESENSKGIAAGQEQYFE